MRVQNLNSPSFGAVYQKDIKRILEANVTTKQLTKHLKQTAQLDKLSTANGVNIYYEEGPKGVINQYVMEDKNTKNMLYREFLPKEIGTRKSHKKTIGLVEKLIAIMRKNEQLAQIDQ